MLRLRFGSMTSKAHRAYIALGRPMTSIFHQGLSLGLCPTLLSLISPLLSTFGLLIFCRVLSGGRQWQIHLYFCTDLASTKKGLFYFIREIRFPYDWWPIDSCLFISLGILKSLLLDALLLPLYLNWSISRGLQLKLKMAPSC